MAVTVLGFQGLPLLASATTCILKYMYITRKLT